MNLKPLKSGKPKGLTESLYFFSFCVFGLLNVATPRIVSWDGYLYLSSGLSLFTHEMNSWYHWAREPGYPLVIWLCMRLGSLEYLFLIQNIVLAISCVLFVKSWNKNEAMRMSQKFSRFSILLMALGLHGYANSVLQTTWLIFVCSLLTFAVTHSSTHKKIFTLLMPIIAISSSLLAIGIAFAFVCLSIILLFMKSSKLSHARIPLLLSILICLSTSLGWIGIKNSFDFKQSNHQGINSAFESFRVYTGAQPLATTIDQIIQTPFSLIGLAPERYNGLANQTLSGEAKIFGATRFQDVHVCGLLYPGPGSFPEFVAQYTNLPCIPWNAVNLISLIGKVTGVVLFPLAGLGTLVLFIWTIFQRKEKWIILLPGILILLPYILLGAGISRYGAPFFAFGILGLLNLPKFFTKLE